MTRNILEIAAAIWSIDMDSARLQIAASAAIEAGLQSDSLARVADDACPEDERAELFFSGLDELKVPVPEKRVAALIFAQEIARRILEGELRPYDGGNDDLPQNSPKANAPRNSLIINAEVISHNHFPPTRPEKRFSPLISRHRTRVTGLQ